MTPREKFQRDKQAVKSHAALVDDQFTESTFDVALAEMLWRQPSSAPVPDALRQSERLHGAKEFIRIWRGLSDAKKETGDDSERAAMYAGGLQPEDDELPRKPRK